MKGLPSAVFVWEKMKRSGFTLNEILIAVVIISILGSLAMVTYVRVYEKGRGYSAVTILRMIRAAERVYYLDHNEYTPLDFVSFPDGCISSLVTEGYLQCPNAAPAEERAFGYLIVHPALPPERFQAGAIRLSGRFRFRTITLEVLRCDPCPGPEVPTWGGTWPAELMP